MSSAEQPFGRIDFPPRTRSSPNTTLPEAAAADAGEPPILKYPTGAVKCRERLGGLLKHYYRAAA